MFNLNCFCITKTLNVIEFPFMSRHFFIVYVHLHTRYCLLKTLGFANWLLMERFTHFEGGRGGGCYVIWVPNTFTSFQISIKILYFLQLAFVLRFTLPPYKGTEQPAQQHHTLKDAFIMFLCLAFYPGENNPGYTPGTNQNG